MGYTNSPLVQYTKLSPNHSGLRNHAIDTISIHCVVGQCYIETLGNVFADPNREASSNYGIGYDGKIGMFVEEKNRSWCTSSSSNDNRAITIEVASDTYDPFRVNDAAYESLIKLCADICKRNGIKELKWKADPSLIGQVDKQNMTVHRWFANKGCPGDYLYNRHYDIAKRVNALLGNSSTVTESTKTTTTTNTTTTSSGNKSTSTSTTNTYPKVPFLVTVLIDDLWIRKEPNGANVKFIPKNTYTITEVKDGCWGKLKSGAGWIWIANPSYVKIGKSVATTTNTTTKTTPANTSKTTTKTTNTFKSYVINVTSTNGLNVRKGPGTSYGIVTTIPYNGMYTIVEEKGNWGKLKSGAGWICLDYTKKV